MRVLAAAFIAVLLGFWAPVAAQGFRWWNDGEAKQYLALTDAQSSRLDVIFKKALPLLRANRKALDVEQEKLDRYIAEGHEAAAIAQLDAVAAAQIRRNTDRTRMLLEMGFVLTETQRIRLRELNELRARRRDARGR